ERSASSRVIQVRVSSGSESPFHTENGMRFILAPRSANARHSSIPENSQGSVPDPDDELALALTSLDTISVKSGHLILQILVLILDVLALVLRTLTLALYIPQDCVVSFDVALKSV
nr:hypothetical protein [Tanacetum cinerariifolium]